MNSKGNHLALLLALIFVIPVFASNGTTSPRTAAEMVAQGYKRYNVESGIIYYELTGTSSGVEVVYFKDWGWREARYKTTVMKLFGKKHEDTVIEYLDGEWMYSYNEENKHVMKINNPVFENLMKNMGNNNMTEVGEQMMEGMGEKIGQAEFLGKPCDIWVIQGLNTKTWVWKGTGLNLKEEAKLLGIKVNRVATQIDFDSKIDNAKFELPADAKVRAHILPETAN
jgi:hypothetical protein